MKNLCENERFDDKFSSEGGHTAWNPFDSSSPCYLYKYMPIWTYIPLLLLSTSFLSFETKKNNNNNCTFKKVKNLLEDYTSSEN
jgi:hypothetical protein